jgi:hypothetical protein
MKGSALFLFDLHLLLLHLCSKLESPRGSFMVLRTSMKVALVLRPMVEMAVEW